MNEINEIIVEEEHTQELKSSQYPYTFQHHLSVEQAISDFESRVGEWHDMKPSTISIDLFTPQSLLSAW